MPVGMWLCLLAFILNLILWKLVQIEGHLRKLAHRAPNADE